VTDTRDIIHQIEYRWHDTRDLSPVASTMSHESLRGWDSWIRGWVRHPHVDELWESACYQVLPTGRAALAWRYEDSQAAERADGTRGRPLVSRVLAGQASQLTPEVAIVLCRTGPSAMTGPPPGQVTTGTELSVLRADELDALVREVTAGFDEEAAEQEGLWQLVAAALAEPSTPLAIHVRDTHIFKLPADGVQCPLLWGLRRIVWPLLGTAGRRWSFSTFEPPLGEVDPATLPDILFRQAQDVPLAAPAITRKEIKVRPFAPEPPNSRDFCAELAGWLVAEYQKRGGDELKQLITEWCSGEPAVQPRLYKVYDELRAMQSPVLVAGSPASFVSVAPVVNQDREPDPGPMPAGSREPAAFVADEPARAEPEGSALAEEGSRPGEGPIPVPQELDTAGGQARHGQQGPHPHESVEESVIVSDQQIPDRNIPVSQTGADEDRPAWMSRFGEQDLLDDNWNTGIDDRLSPSDIAPGQQGTTPAYSSPSWARHGDDALGLPREGNPAPLSPPGQDRQFRAPAPKPSGVSDLLKILPAAEDIHEFEAILEDVLNPVIQPDFSGRVKARREVSKDGWYENICERFGDILDVTALSGIFEIIVIPDLDSMEVARKIADWADYAQPAVIGGLLAAARQSGDDAWQLIMQILQPKLAYRWTVENYIQQEWDLGLASQPASDPGRGRFGFRKKN
jgi:hypothetical protein